MGLSLKQWRLAKEISQEKMAAACGVHRNTYAAWEENPDDISVGNAKKRFMKVWTLFFLTMNLQNVGSRKERESDGVSKL